MTHARFVGLFALIGIAVPAAWLAFWRVAATWLPDVTGFVMAHSWIGYGLQLLWPSSFLLIGDPEDGDLLLPAIAIVINVILYTVAGLFVWMALKKSLLLLTVPLALFTAAWFYVFSL